MSITDSSTLHQSLADDGVNYVFVGSGESTAAVRGSPDRLVLFHASL